VSFLDCAPLHKLRICPHAGPIPSKIAQLVNLCNLNLRNNKLKGVYLCTIISTPAENPLHTGTIPSELGQLDNLDYLDLSGNELQGERETFACIAPHQQKLRICPNLGSIPLELGQQTNLEQLTLYQNKLEGMYLILLYITTHTHIEDSLTAGSIPSELRQLVNLYNLNLSGNALTGKRKLSFFNIRLTQIKILSFYRLHSLEARAAG